MQSERSLQIAGYEFAFSCEFDQSQSLRIELEVDIVPDIPDSCLIRCILKEPTESDFTLHQFAIHWSVPIVDMHGLYFGGNPGPELARLPFWNITKRTCSNTGVPYIALIHRNGENRAAFGLLDQLTETTLSARLSEATRCYHFAVQKQFGASDSSTGRRVSGQWEECFFVSIAHEAWPTVLSKYVRATDEITAPSKMPVPDHAYEPVFCSWTAIHHDVSHDWIMRNATLAAGLGFKTWITDDGWFIPQGKFADYSFTGDWEPYKAKFPDFQVHVRAVQDLGFRYVLWLAPFMVGKESEAAKRYAPLLTTGDERLNFSNLAPWEPDTREHIANLFERLVGDYQLDGLKIDFIDSIASERNDHSCTADTSIGESIYTTLKTATDRMRALKPDILIEFRNTYANLASRSYANIYRSSDVPINFAMNRWQAVMLRLLAPDRAVHLDPALWHPHDSDENVAVHLINCLVSVPMVSIELEKYPQSHLDLIRHWIGFYNEHRATIVHGEFQPTLSLGHVPVIYFVGDAETIIGLYEDVPVALERGNSKVWILNASTRPYLALESDSWAGEWESIVRNKFGQVRSEQRIHFPTAPLSVEVGGSLELRRL